MPRGRLSRRWSSADRDVERIRLFAEHHIQKVRFAKGDVVAVKHCTFGWISPQAYWALQELHTALPKIIEGGYRLKEALWGLNAVVGPVSVPVGLLFPFLELRALKEALDAGNIQNALLWTYAAIGPFGDILAVLAVYDWLTAAGVDVVEFFAEPFGGLKRELGGIKRPGIQLPRF